MRTLLAAIAATLIVVPPARADAPDPAAAERQYKVARRLAADGSPKAAEAFRDAVALAPKGPLADDALVEGAILAGLPSFPDDLGRVTAEGVGSAEPLLRRVLADLPASDRALEARYRAALLLLEPEGSGPSADPAAIAARVRVELLAVAGRPDSPWADAARYTMSWIDERAGDLDRAAGGYRRVAIDRPGSEAALRARAGIGRILLRRGAHGPAAARLQEAIDDGAHAATWRDLAVRGLRRTAAPAWRWESASPEVLAAEGYRAVQALAPGPGSTILASDRKGGLVSRLDAGGRVLERWSLDEPSAVATDPFGRMFAIAGDAVYRLAPDAALEVASLPRIGGGSSLAIDDGGRVWVLDRKGERVYRAVPGEAPVVDREFKDAPLAAIVWDGRRLVAVEERGGRIIAWSPGGAPAAPAAVAETGLKRATALAVDPSGGVLVTDARAGECVLLDPAGSVADRFRVPADSEMRIAAATLTGDGTLVLVDGTSGALEAVR